MPGAPLVPVRAWSVWRARGVRRSGLICITGTITSPKGAAMASGAGGSTASLATFLADCALLSLSSFSALLAAAKT